MARQQNEQPTHHNWRLLLAPTRESLLPARAAKNKWRNKKEGLPRHSGDDSDVSPGPQGDTVGFTHWARPPFLWVTASHPGKAWGPSLAQPKISKLGKCPVRWAGGMSIWGHWQQAPPAPGRQATPVEAEPSDRAYSDPEALWKDWATQPEASATLRLPRVWTQPSSLFCSLEEVLRSTQVMSSQPRGHLPSHQDFSPASSHTGCPHALCLVCLDTLSFVGTCLQRHWWQYQKTKSCQQQHILGLHPLYLSETIGPFVKDGSPHLRLLFLQVVCFIFGWWMEFEKIYYYSLSCYQKS